MPRLSWSRWKELNRHRSIINRVLWPLSYTAMVDPTGLKPAPHGLKGRRSVTRAPGQKDWLWRKDSNLRMAALTVRCLTNLATPQKVNLAAATRLELAHPRLQDECSVIQLSYAAIWWTGRDSNPHKKFAGLLCCRYITSPKTLVAVGGVEPPTSRL
jgi:hypothetical protein